MYFIVGMGIEHAQQASKKVVYALDRLVMTYQRHLFWQWQVVCYVGFHFPFGIYIRIIFIDTEHPQVPVPIRHYLPFVFC